VADLLPRLRIEPASEPVDVADLFPFAPGSITLEIGFGGGEHLAARARAHPEAGFIGCEPFVNGMAKALAIIDAQKIANIRLHPADAMELLDWMPDASIARVDLLYPDPWPKRRHWKRRFINDESVAKLARIIRPGGEFRFASDWANYADWTLLRLARSPDFTWQAERADDWRKPWREFIRTRYEAKAVREGRTPCYLVFRRN
jgi:tRNA (guanine-N7-)-methyltransferase